MKFNIIMSFTLFLFEIVVVFPSLTFAVWSSTNPPKPPEDDMPRTCTQWIEYHGFTLNDYDANRAMAVERDYKLDKLASSYAAIYAFFIGGLMDLFQVMPHDFCDTFGDENLVAHEFVALEDEFKTCNEWITLYRFHDSNYIFNYIFSMNVDPEKAFDISLWAYTFWVYIWVNEPASIGPITAEQFCLKLGINVGPLARPTSFMCERETLLTCRGWLELFDFVDNPSTNLIKAINVDWSSNIDNNIRSHYFSMKYAMKLLKLYQQNRPVNHMTPLHFCRKFNGDGDQVQKYALDYNEQL